MSNSGLIAFSVFMLAVFVLFLMAQLKTHINERDLLIHFQPFMKRRVPWKEITRVTLVNYGSMGWGLGIRYDTKYGTIYNMGGKMGLAIELLDGKKFLIGTQKEEELSKYLKTLGN